MALYLPVDVLLGGSLFTVKPAFLPGYVDPVNVAVPAVGATCKVFARDADQSTATPIAVYPNEDGSGVALAQPLVADSMGRFGGYVAQPVALDLAIAGGGVVSRTVKVGLALSTAFDAAGAAASAMAAAEAASDALGAAAAAQAAAEAWSAQGLAPTALLTGAQSIAAGQMVRLDISAGSGTGTLPSAPVDRTRCALKVSAVNATPGTFAATLFCGSGDTFSTGGTSRTLKALGEGVIVQYRASDRTWTTQGTDSPFDVGLGAARTGSDGTVGGSGGSALAAKIVVDGSAAPKAIDSTGVVSGQALVYDSVAGKFKPLGVVQDLAATPRNIDSTGAADTNVLAFQASSGKFVPAPAAVGGSTTIAALGDGTDGSMTLDGTTAFAGFSTLNAGTHTYTLTRDVNAINMTVAAGVTVLPFGFMIRCTGTLTINATGVISFNGNAGAANGTAAAQASASGSNAYFGGGSSGGAGNTGAGTAGPGLPGGTFGGGAGGAGGGGSAGGAGSVTATVTARLGDPAWLTAGVVTSGSSFIRPTGGAGGAGGTGDGVVKGGGGGGGGGSFAIAASAIVNNGSISAVGGNGGSPASGNAGGGGGGGGGSIFIYTHSGVSGSGTISNAGGSAGTPSGTGGAGAAGSAGTLYQRTI